MDKTRNYLIFGVLSLVVSLVAVSLAYAGFTATLNITGTGAVKAAKWDVHFANLQPVTKTGTAVENTAPTVNGTTLGTYSVTLNAPGDAVTYTFDVENKGNFAAKWTGLTIGTPTCSGGDANAPGVCNNITYELYEGSTKKTSADNSTLAANTGKKTYKLILTYKASNDPSVLPASKDVTIGNLGVTFTYTQEGGYVAPSA